MPVVWKELVVKYRSDMADALRGLEHVNARIAATSRDIETRYGALAGRLRGIGMGMSAGLTLPITLATKAAVEARLRMDSLERGLTAIMGTGKAARAEMTRLEEVAKLPGLGFEEAMQGSLNLQAVGMSAKQARETLMAFGNALATVGKGKNELAAVQEQVMQVLSKGKVMTEDVRIIRNYVPQISQAMKAAFGTANAEEIAKMGVSGEEFIRRINEQLAKLPKMTSGLRNTLENASDAANKALSRAGKAMEPVVTKFAEVETAAAQAFTALPEGVQMTIVGFAGLLGAAGPVLMLLANVRTLSVLGKLAKVQETAATVGATAATVANTGAVTANSAAVVVNAGACSRLLTVLKGPGALIAAVGLLTYTFGKLFERNRSAAEQIGATGDAAEAAARKIERQNRAEQKRQELLSKPLAKSGREQLGSEVAKLAGERTAAEKALEEAVVAKYGPTQLKMYRKPTWFETIKELDENIRLARGTGVYGGKFRTGQELENIIAENYKRLAKIDDLRAKKREELAKRGAVTRAAEKKAATDAVVKSFETPAYDWAMTAAAARAAGDEAGQKWAEINKAYYDRLAENAKQAAETKGFDKAAADKLAGAEFGADQAEFFRTAAEKAEEDRKQKTSDALEKQRKATEESVAAQRKAIEDWQTARSVAYEAAVIGVRGKTRGAARDLQVGMLEANREMEGDLAKAAQAALEGLDPQVYEQMRANAYAKRDEAVREAQEEHRRFGEEQRRLERQAAIGSYAKSLATAGYEGRAKQWEAYGAYVSQMSELNDLGEQGIDVTKRKQAAEMEYRAALLASVEDQIEAIRRRSDEEKQAALARLGWTDPVGMWREAMLAGQRARFGAADLLPAASKPSAGGGESLRTLQETRDLLKQLITAVVAGNRDRKEGMIYAG